jgi:hypothetical protein
MIRLPVSGIDVSLRAPGGADDIALIEGDPAVLVTALRLLTCLAARTDGAAADWPALPVTDFEILLLRLRQFLIGPVIASHVACPDCRERVEVSFQVDDYIAAIRAATPPNLTRAPGESGLGGSGSGEIGGRQSWPGEGWMTIGGTAFRLPRVAGLLAVRRDPRPATALRARCLAPGKATGLPKGLLRRVETALARLAPRVSGPVGGTCPACGITLEALFDVPAYVVAEARRLAAGVYGEIHLLATAYGWDEPAILALPGARRRHYAELVSADIRHHEMAA